MASVSRRYLLLKNTGLSLGTWILPILPSLIATPVLIRRLGNADFGLYIGVVSLISYFFTAGIGRVATKYVAEDRGAESSDRVSQVISATIILSQAAGLLCVGIIVVAARFLVISVLNTPPQQEETAVLALYLACAIVLTTTLGQIFQFAITGVQRFGNVFIVTSLSSALFNFGSIAVVVLGYGVTGLFVWMLVVNAGTAVVFYTLSRRFIPEFRFTFQIGGRIWRQVGVYSGSIIVHQIFGNVLFLFERGWILRKFGSEVLAFYAVAMTLAMYIQLFASNLVLASFPSINELLREPEKLRRLYQKSTKYVLAFVVFAAVSMFIAGKTFLGLWVGSDFAFAASLFLSIHILTFAILAMNTVVWQVNESHDAAALNSAATFVWMAVSIPLMIWLADSMSASGVAVARLIGVIVFVPFLFWSEARFLGSQVSSLWLPISWRIVVAAGGTAAAEISILSAGGQNWPTFAASVLAGFFVFIGILVLCRSFDREEMQFFESIVFRRSAANADPIL